VIIICFLVSKFDEDKDKKDYLKLQIFCDLFPKKENVLVVCIAPIVLTN